MLYATAQIPSLWSEENVEYELNSVGLLAVSKIEALLRAMNARLQESSRSSASLRDMLRSQRRRIRREPQYCALLANAKSPSVDSVVRGHTYVTIKVQMPM